MNHYNGYGAYLLFIALKTHFSSKKYDFVTMQGKLKANKHSYDSRRDKFFFEKLAKRYTASELKDFYISNFLADKQYVTELLTEEANSIYFDYVRRNQMLTYNFKTEVEKLFERGVSNVFKLKSDQYPVIIIKYMNNCVSPETMVILDSLIHYSDKFNKSFENDIIWSKLSLKLSKYSRFVKYDKDKVKQILKEVAKDHI